MRDKVAVEIDWDNKIVSVSLQDMSTDISADYPVQILVSQMIAVLVSKHAYDLMMLSSEEIKVRHLEFLKDL